MVRSFTRAFELLQKSLTRSVGLLLVTTQLLAACGRFDYQIPRHNFSNDGAARTTRDYATFSVRYDASADPYTLSLRKSSHGTALQAPVYSDNEGMESHLSFSRGGEFKNFIGLETSFSF